MVCKLIVFSWLTNLNKLMSSNSSLLHCKDNLIVFSLISIRNITAVKDYLGMHFLIDSRWLILFPSMETRLACCIPT